MSKHSGSTDVIHRVIVNPEITRAYWSKARAWHGAELKLYVETRHVEDDTALTLRVFERDRSRGTGDEPIVELTGHKIQSNRCTVAHKLNWDEKTLGKKLVLKGNAMEFRFVAVIESHAISKRSNALYVDLHGFVLSS